MTDFETHPIGAIKEAFMAGFDAGAEDAHEAGKIICEDFKREVTEKAYADWIRDA